ncbi:MAG TPA: DUF2079 domain-containing protein [Candidatus Baltobacteraceae bacterium]|nr:DUF2079 domain-containing protein [Candidatus Baltobacteraceae bacterium]
MRDKLLWSLCILYAAVFTWLGTIKYAAHRNLVDFGIFAQTVASAFGCFCNAVEGSHWAYHFSPILYVVAIAVWLFHSPITLVALQAIAGALVAPPIYAIVARRSDVTTARLAAAVVLLYPPLAGLTFGDFHENGFAPAAVAWTLYAYDAGLLVWGAVCAALTLAVKEDQALFLAFAGAAGAFVYRDDRRRRRFALAVAGAAIAVAIVFFVAIQPHARAAVAHWQPVRFYAWTAAEVRALVPRGILDRLGFLLLILAPLAFVPLRARAMLLAVPPLLEVLLSRMSTTFTLGSHYAGAWIGYLLVAFAAGVVGLAERNRARRALLWAIGLCVVELLVANPLHPGLNLRPPQRRDAVLDAALKTLPPGISVATQEEAYTHLALNDPYARLLPERSDVETHACFILIDRSYPQSPRLQEYGSHLRQLVQVGRYVLVQRAAGIGLYRSVTACR